ncbi:serine/threonine protein kinase [Thermomicrobium sp. CFH 73360]|uniref:serine/threonine-protein kinase n=1 Tax=Thermomicrobium sp. CFH 73360 TaxID=2951987 RepID=UPI0020777319|nr:serine/threonine protein kinase [Thermomicrobium sp. CFH 73360]
MFLSPPRVIGGRYRLEQPLGTGGMATTYLARDLVLERPVAVKILRADSSDAREEARFAREARAAAAVSHPNVVQLYDAGRDGELRYLVLEWVDGGDLAHLIRERAPLPVDEAVRLALDVLNGLAAIHRAGIVHRDVKPANVLLDRHGRAKLTDFGIARRADEPTLTGPVDLLGTAAYVAPERIRGQPATAASDLYAVGVLLYELLTGRLPFPGQTPDELLAQHLHTTPVPLRRWRRDIPPALEQVVRRALVKEPELRYRSAEAMAAALQAASLVGKTSAQTDAPALTTARPGRARSGTLRLAGGVTVLSLAVIVLLALFARAQVPGEQSAPTPTVTAVVLAPADPTATPTVLPTPTQQPTPTPPATPTPVPTPTPSEVQVLLGSLKVLAPTPPELRRFTDAPALTFAPEELVGAYLPSRDGALQGFSRDLTNAALLFGSGSGTEQASVSFVIPAGTERLLIQVEGRQHRGDPVAALQMELAGWVIWDGQNPFAGAGWSTMNVVLQFDRLQSEVPVTLTLRNVSGPGGRGAESWLAVRLIRVLSAV